MILRGFGASRKYKLAQGVLLILLGLVVLWRPEVILVSLALILATVLIVVGLFNIFWSWSSGPRP